MRFLRQSMIGLFLAAATLGLLALAVSLIVGAVQQRMAEEPKAPPARERVFAVNTVVAEARDASPLIESYGEVQSGRTLELRAAQAGRVIELAPEFVDGGAVTEGQLLLRLDPADAEAAVARAENDLEDAEAEVRDAERALALAEDDRAAAQEQAELRARAFTRQSDLAQRGVGTAAATETAELAASAARQAVVSRRQAVAQAQARGDQARTGLARARITLAEARRRLEDTRITAPFTGTLTATDVLPGRRVTANERLAELIDPDDLEVSFRLSTAQFARLLDDSGTLAAAPITVTLDVAGVDLSATGRITRAAAAAEAGATGRRVFAVLDAAPGFKPGDFVTVGVREPVLTGIVELPASAVDAAGEVLVLGAENRLEVRRVEVLRRQGDAVLVAPEGLLGAQVVAERSPLLGAGIAVRPLQPRSEATPAADTGTGTTGEAGLTDRAAQTSASAEMVELSEERRARLIAFIETNDRMPEAAKARVLARLSEPRLPATFVARLESRMGG